MCIPVSGQIAITGLGLVTPLGQDLEQTWHALLEGRFISGHTRVQLHDRGPRVCLLSLEAARQAITHARWTKKTLLDPATALIVGTSKGPVEEWIAALQHIHKNPCVMAGDSVIFGLGKMTRIIADELGMGSGARTALSAACASGLHALIWAWMLISNRQAERALVVAAEASVHPLFIGSFQRMGVLPADGIGCRPFDRDRDGFLISEAAAAVCLQAEHRDTSAIACIDRLGLAADATHLTGCDPEAKALARLLNRVIADQPVDLIHAHATGTRMNDQAELAAIEANIHQSDQPLVYSHKGALGHSLGASGLVSVVINCMSHRTGIVPPNVQTHRAIETHRVCISSQRVRRLIRRSVAIAAGFGGALGAVSLVSPEAA